MRPCISIRGLVRFFVGWFVGNDFVKIGENLILQVLDEKERGGWSEEDGARRREQ